MSINPATTPNTNRAHLARDDRLATGSGSQPYVEGGHSPYADGGIQNKQFRIWRVVIGLIRANREQFDPTVATNAVEMRGSFYTLRGLLEPYRKAGHISDDEFAYAVDNYKYYSGKIWATIEATYGFTRPPTKDNTIIIKGGSEYAASAFDDINHRAQGFIYVEKKGVADNLVELSRHGWVILAGQGEPTRSFRERVANDGTDRPILVLSDYDVAGAGMAETWADTTDRTEHLDLADKLGPRVLHLGLRESDCRALDLPAEHDPTARGGDERTELNALEALRARGVSNPYLGFVVTKLAANGLPLHPVPLVRAAQEGQVVSEAKIAIRQTLAPAYDALDRLVKQVGERAGLKIDPDDLPSDGDPIQLVTDPDGDHAGRLGEQGQEQGDGHPGRHTVNRGRTTRRNRSRMPPASRTWTVTRFSRRCSASTTRTPWSRR